MQYHKFSSLFCAVFALLFFISLQVQAAPFIKAAHNFESQRQIYKGLLDDDKLGKTRAAQYNEQLLDYPLLPYIELLWLLNNPRDAELKDYEDFFSQHDDLASSSYLRKLLLISLGEKKDWENYVRFYKEPAYFLSDSQTLELECFKLQADRGLRIQTFEQNQILQQAIEPTESEEKTLVAKPPELLDTEINQLKIIFLSGNSLPASCDPLFELMENEELIDDELRLKRIQLAIEQNNFSLAKYLSNTLSDESLKQYEQGESLRKSPEQLKAKEFVLDDTEFNRFSITEALKQILQSDPALAKILWLEQSKRYAYSQEEKDRFTQDAAMSLFIRDSDFFESWLEIANHDFRDTELNLKTLVMHIREHNWEAIISMYPQLKQTEKSEAIWQYWYARAYIEFDQSTYIHPNAYRLLNALSKKRDYYGFLASFHLNNTPVLSEHSFPIKEADLQKVAANKNIMRAHEFFMLGDRDNASREWYTALQGFDKKQRGNAAILAFQWGWLDQAIISASQSNQFNNINLRFPLGFSEWVNFNATRFNIPNEWVFATIRQESAYGVDAQSHAGAMGLMQIMPYTGKVLAKENHLKRFNVDDLFQPKLNIQLGSYYLSELKQQYDGNMLLASAAYNAGPSKVNQWLRESPDMDLEMWIETIPYKETRNYVKNILTYQIIYQHRLGREITAERLFLPIK